MGLELQHQGRSRAEGGGSLEIVQLPGQIRCVLFAVDEANSNRYSGTHQHKWATLRQTKTYM